MTDGASTSQWTEVTHEFPTNGTGTASDEKSLARSRERRRASENRVDESRASRVGAGVANGVAGTYRTRRVTHRSDMPNIPARNLPRPRVANLPASDPKCLQVLQPVPNSFQTIIDRQTINVKTSIGNANVTERRRETIYERT